MNRQSYHFRHVPETPDKAWFLIFKGNDPKPSAFVEFADNGYTVTDMKSLSLTEQLDILKEADNFRGAFFDPDYFSN